MSESNVPEGLRYTAEHEWVDPTGEATVRIGITDYAQAQLGDVVFVQLPSVGDEVVAGDSMGEVESTKSVSDVFSPLTGSVVAVNEALGDAPELVNTAPYGDGWLVEVSVADAAALEAALAPTLDAAGYVAVIDG